MTTPLSDMRGCKSLHAYAVMLEKQNKEMSEGLLEIESFHFKLHGNPSPWDAALFMSKRASIAMNRAIIDVKNEVKSIQIQTSMEETICIPYIEIKEKYFEEERIVFTSNPSFHHQIKNVAGHSDYLYVTGVSEELDEKCWLRIGYCCEHEGVDIWEITM